MKPRAYRTPVLVACALLLGSFGIARAVGAGHLVELEVLGVVPLESESASLLVLRQKGARTVLPIFVGKQEGAAIAQRLKQPPGQRPHGPDLLAKAIGALGGRVSRVAIEGAQAALYSARITLEQGEKRIDVEARPSDSVALAIVSHAPIFATRTLLAEAGLTEEDLARAHGGGAARDRKSGGDDPLASTAVQSF